MKLVYTAYNPILVANVRNLLENAGISCAVKNLLLGGGAGELPLNEIWPEVWVAEGDLARAEAILAQAEGEGEGWCCPACGEENGGAFELCWRCGAPRDGRCEAGGGEG